MDEDNIDFNSAFDTLRETFGKSVAPLVVPIWDENKRVTGVVDVLHKRAFEPAGNKRKEIPIPADKVDVINEIYDELLLLAVLVHAGGGHALEGVGQQVHDEVQQHQGAQPVQGGAAHHGHHGAVLHARPQALHDLGVGEGLAAEELVHELLAGFGHGLHELVIDLVDHVHLEEEFITSQGAVPAAFVFKTVADQYGKFSFIKVLSGDISSDMTLVNATTGQMEKLGRLYVMKGKKSEEVKQLLCGDIGETVLRIFSR